MSWSRRVRGAAHLAIVLALSACVSLPPSPPPTSALPSASSSPGRSPDPTPTPAPDPSQTPVPTVEPTPVPTPTIDPTSVFLGMDYACDDGPAFQPGLLTGPANAESEDHPTAAALRALIASPETQGDGLPSTGWWRLERTATSATYLARSTLDRRFVEASLVVRDGAWAPEGYGTCQAQLRRANLGATFLGIDPAFPPDASTRRLHLLVNELRCSSGKRIGERLREPIVEMSADQVRIAFGVVPLPGAQDCQGVRPTPVVVDLGAPLGDRQVVNASVLPFQPLGEEF